MQLRELMWRPRAPFLVVLAICVALVAGGVLMAEFMRLAACPLCIVQRMLYLLLALLALIGIPLARHPLRPVMLTTMLAAAGTGIFVAGYQVWIQRFAPDTSCSGRMTWWEELVDWAGDQVPLLFKASGLCSDPAWKVLGLSIADWSLGFFTLLFCVAVYGFFGARRRA